MRERVTEQNGRFEISSDERGTVIEVRMPISIDENLQDQQATASPTS
jgi:signal transduction histidine kinase